MQQNQMTASTDTLQQIARRLRERLDRDNLERIELLETEMTLRGLMPELEAQLMHMIASGMTGDSRGAASENLMVLSRNLMWIQLNADAAISAVRDRLRESLDCVEQIVFHLAP